jgi:peroxiredoxin
MKKLIFIAIVLGVFACSQTPSYKITVKLEGAKGKMILEQRKGNEIVVKDSADIKGGVAVLKGVVDYPTMSYLSIKGERRKMMLFVENSNITVTGKVDSLNAVKITGSVTQSEYEAINSQILEINKKCSAIYQESKKAKDAGDELNAKKLEAEGDSIYEIMGKTEEDFVKTHPASYATPFFLGDIQYEKDEVQLEQLLNGLDKKLDSIPTIVSLRGRVEKMKTVAVGKQAPDFTQNDPDGKPVKFSDVYSKNKYTLVDFWASWCGPCRQENPNVVAVYKEFNKKGFSVLGVSLDRAKDSWLQAIQKDGLTWQHVSDLQYWNNEAAALYAINSIPANLLVDSKGTIIAKGLRGDALKAKIAELLK